MKPDVIEVYCKNGEFRARLLAGKEVIFESAKGYRNRANAVQFIKGFVLRHDRRTFDIAITDAHNDKTPWTKPEKFHQGGMTRKEG